MPTQDSQDLTTQSEEAMEQADADLDQAIDTALDDYEDKPSGEEAEPPSTEEAEPSKEATPSTEDRGDGRDELGQYASHKTEEGEDATPAEAVPEAGEEAVPEPVTDAEPEAGKVFDFRADGTDFEVPGSTVSEKGLHIPPEQIESVTQLLRFGKTYQGTFRDKLAGKDAEVAAAGVRENAATAARTSLLEKLAQFGENPDAMAAFLDDFHTNLPVLLAEAKAVEAEALRTSDKERLVELEQQVELDRMTPQLEDRLEEAIKHYGNIAGLDTDGMRTIWARLREPTQFGTIFTQGEDGWKEELSHVEREVQYLATAVGGRGVVQRKEAVTNAAALKPDAEVKKAPPTAPTKKGPAPKATAKAPKFESTEQADEWFEGGGYNEYFE